jgi:hypothetical protein
VIYRARLPDADLRLRMAQRVPVEGALSVAALCGDLVWRGGNGRCRAPVIRITILNLPFAMPSSVAGRSSRAVRIRTLLAVLSARMAPAVAASFLCIPLRPIRLGLHDV